MKKLMLLLAFALVSAAATADDTAKLPAPEHGVICLTFDDRNFDDWIAALPLLRKYDAKVTFFVCGEIDDAAAAKLKLLKADGHAVGSHSLNHKAVPGPAEMDQYVEANIVPHLEQFKKAGIEVTSFAYPYSRRSGASDKALGKYFRHMRAGVFPPKGKTLVEMEQAFVPADKMAEARVLHGRSSDVGSNPTPDESISAIERAAKNNELFVFYSHRISAKPVKSHYITPERLELLLKKGKELGVQFRSFDQLP